MNHLVSHIQNPELRRENTLHVVLVCSNPVRFHSRYRLARECLDAMRSTPHVEAYMVEAAHGDRHHEVTNDLDDAHRLQVRTKSEIWIKENLINLGVRHLVPHTAKYIAWVDADVFFRDPNWAQETLHQLQTFEVVQPWQQCTDLGPQGSILQTHESFGFLHQAGVPKHPHGVEPYKYAHSGFAWACTRAFWERTGGLLDHCIFGSGDHHMAWAMLGRVDDTINPKMEPGYFRACRTWQSRAVAACAKQVGFTPGRAEHGFHGPKKRRYYVERWQILVNHKFCPEKDLYYDAAGVLQLAGRPDLEQALRLYNRSRAEDSIEV